VELSERRLRIEVAYARAPEPLVVTLEVPAGSTVREAIAASGVLERCPGIELARCGVGVFGRPRGLDDPVADGDRVEVYRPLPQDPKELRRRRAKRS
jgi:putative ubiquitin-RnfH superfamily antitoxin RatB of RatAB toxin-antitoxin module